MWLSRMLNSKGFSQKAENGFVTVATNDMSEINSSVCAARDVEMYSPYGYESTVPAGEEVILVASSKGQAALGTTEKQTNLEAGEIRITSLGGASITLKNDGTILLNSTIIEKSEVDTDD